MSEWSEAAASPGLTSRKGEARRGEEGRWRLRAAERSERMTQ
jgi:hypothetical protein